MLATLKPYIYIIGGIIAFNVLWVIYARLAHRNIQPDTKGRVKISPGPISYIFGCVCVAQSLLFGWLMLETMITQEWDIFWLCTCPPMTALMLWGAYIIFFVRLRAGSNGIEIRRFIVWRKIPWKNVVSVNLNSGLAPMLRMTDSNLQTFWPYGYGLGEVRNMFIAQGKTFDT